MPKPKLPTWKVGRVKRTDSGGTLWNAIHIKTGREYYGCPSYDGEAIARRVHCLNFSNVKLHRGKAANPLAVLDQIFEELDGREWNADTPQNIAEILIDAGYEIRSPEDSDDAE